MIGDKHFEAIARTESVEYTLTQQAEIIRGAADSLAKNVVTLQSRLGRMPLEKDYPTTGHPERAINGPHDILRNAYDDLMRAGAILEALIIYVGLPGEAPSGATSGNAAAPYRAR